MKKTLSFNFTIEGGDSAEKKFLEAIQSKPNLTQEVARGFGSILCLAFGWSAEDEVGIKSFTIGKPKEEISKQEEPQSENN